MIIRITSKFLSCYLHADVTTAGTIFICKNVVKIVYLQMFSLASWTGEMKLTAELHLCTLGMTVM